LETKTYRAGAVIIKEEEVSRKMYIIRSGKVNVFKTHMGKKIPLATLGHGEIFGEMSFLDAKPRSATVQVLEDAEVMILDGESIADKSQLPEWVKIILKSVFYRFREMDQKVAAYQAFSDFKTNPFNKEEAPKAIYTELRRFTQILLIIVKDNTSKDEHLIEVERVHKELTSLLGNTLISVKAYLTSLIDNHIITTGELNRKIFFEFDLHKLKLFSEYLDKEIKSDRYLLLSHSAIALLRAIVGNITSEDNQLDPEEHKFIEIPLYEQAVDELVEKSIIEIMSGQFTFENTAIHEHCEFQAIIKGFDHSIVYE
jgi:CRP-like cAMP-binding protein